jgi:CRP/FNR family transcriptional regulator, cyclic AMP receptor protein
MNSPSHPYLYQDIEYLGSASSFVDEVLEAMNLGVHFDQFYRYEAEELCRFLHCFSAPTGTILLKEGEEGDHLIIVLSGHIQVLKSDIHGSSRGIAMVGRGSVIGEMSLIDGEHRFASCIAAEQTQIAVLSRSDLNEIMALHPRLSNKFLLMMLQIMVGRLRDTGIRAINADIQAASF